VIRSTRHHILDANFGKRKAYDDFLSEYNRVSQIVLDKVWKALPEDLSVPRFLNYKDFPVETNLSARILSNIATQISGIVRSAVEKQRRRIWVRENRNPNVKSSLFSKPKPAFIHPQISSKNCDLRKTGGKFWGYVKLKSLGKSYGMIKLPLIKHPKAGASPLAGITLFKTSLQIVWEKSTSPIEKGEKILGADTGLKSLVSLSDGQITPKLCPHGHSYESIIGEISRRKKGSDAFKKSVAHRKNFVNWSINQLDFRGVKELRLEKVSNIRFGKNTSRKLSHWSHPEIRDKLKSRCEELEVPISEQSCAYRSQRCSKCGNVRKANRQGELYVCKSCGFSANADWNAAVNHTIDLPSVQEFAGRKLNLGNGFFWKPEGVFSFGGAELRVPLGARSSKCS
jgi:predicted RNA-binding Zn-ribbon protein involved in translation (DUF1610 family)